MIQKHADDDLARLQAGKVSTPLRWVRARVGSSLRLTPVEAIDHVTRGSNESADVHLKGRDEVLPVGLSYLHLFREM